MVPEYRYRAICKRVVDGDTYHLSVDMGFHCFIDVPVRLYGVDTPEMNTEAGKIARMFAIDHLSHVPLIIKSYKDKQTFGRWVCEVWLPDGTDFSNLLIENGHAVPMMR